MKAAELAAQVAAATAMFTVVVTYKAARFGAAAASRAISHRTQRATP